MFGKLINAALWLFRRLTGKRVDYWKKNSRWVERD